MLCSTVETSSLIRLSLISFLSNRNSVRCLLSFSRLLVNEINFSCDFVISLLSLSIHLSKSSISLIRVALLYEFDKRVLLTFFFHKSFAISSFFSKDIKPSHLENSFPLSLCPILNKSPRLYAVAEITRLKSSTLPMLSLIILLVCCVLSASQFSINS